MRASKTPVLAALMVVFIAVPAGAQHHGVHTASWHNPYAGGGYRQAGGSNGYQGLYLVGFGYGGWYVPSPLLVMNQGGFFPFGVATPPPMILRGPLLPPAPPVDVMAPRPNGNGQQGDPVKAGQRVIVGDRLLRAGNVKKAEERYQQASRSAPDLAAPRVRLAQIAFVRGNYTDAALKLREAETAQPGWIITAPDIQSIYGEPTEFARHIAKLESYIQSHPDDRDAWLVLGAEWFLTGRTAKAADVFQRLNDPRRKPDVALAAFLDASNQAGPRAQNAPEPAQ